jgi:hypothetical protein
LNDEISTDHGRAKYKLIAARQICASVALDAASVGFGGPDERKTRELFTSCPQEASWRSKGYCLLGQVISNIYSSEPDQRVTGA